MVDTVTTAALQGTPKQRMEEEKSVVIRIIPGQRPQVEFGGFWTGKYIQAAQNALAKAYRTRHHTLAYTKKREDNMKVIDIEKSGEEKTQVKQGGDNVK